VRLVADRVPASWVARVLRSEGGVHFLGLERYADLEALLASLRVDGIEIRELALQETDLEQVFLRIMSGGRAHVEAAGGAAGARTPSSTALAK
jgi:ABC-2 type transport system ATP-binding protein